MITAENIELETKEEQKILANNAWHLARYVIEHDHEIEFPKRFDVGQFLYWAENYPNLNAEEKINFVNQYAMLEKTTGKVTARTLFATRIYGRGFLYAVFKTSVGKYLMFLTFVTMVFAAVLVADTEVIPMLFGVCLHIPNVVLAVSAAGLGTCVFLLRITQEKLRIREFDPAYIPSHLIRLGLGILAGASIVFFPGLLNGDENRPMSFELGTLAFILGYAVDIFYAILDNIGGRIRNRK